MRSRKLWLAIVLLLAAGVAAGAITGSTASNLVAPSHAGRITDTITPDKLKPAACAGITVTHLSTGAGAVPGTAANDLILGSAGNDTLGSNAAGQGADCCVGGGGVDTFNKSCAVSVP